MIHSDQRVPFPDGTRLSSSSSDHSNYLSVYYSFFSLCIILHFAIAHYPWVIPTPKSDVVVRANLETAVDFVLALETHELAALKPRATCSGSHLEDPYFCRSDKNSEKKSGMS